jgi:hypothetical protein
MSKRKFGFDLAEDVKINKYALDEESEISSSILYHYGELLAEAKTKQDSMENNLKVLKAKKDLEYRRNPPADLKITESVISSLVESDLEVVESRNAVLDWTAKVNHYYAAVDSLHDKCNRLHDLVDLWSKSYYSTKE